MSGQSGQSSGQSARVGNLNTNEICFIDKAARSNEFEIKSSQLAAKNASSAAVKQLAQRIIRDHQQAGQRLQNVVSRLNARLPDKPNTEQQADITALQGLRGVAFDATYLAQQIAAHREAVTLFEQYSREARDQNVRQFASQTLPALRQHLQAAQQAQKQLGGSGAR